MPRSKNTHGGKRKGAGRKKGEQTIVMRVPVSKVSEVRQIINPSPLVQIHKDIREIASYCGGYEELRELTHMLEAGNIGVADQRAITVSSFPRISD